MRCAECGEPLGPGRPGPATYRWRRPGGGRPPAREALLVCGGACLEARAAVNRRAIFAAGDSAGEDALAGAPSPLIGG